MAVKTVGFELPSHGYRRTMPFNRFFVERLDQLVVIHFGLLSQGGVLLDRYSCGIFQFELEMQKQSVMEYLGKVGSLGDRPPSWQPPAALSPVELFNQIGVSSNPRVAETCLNNLVVRAVNELRQIGAGKIPVDPIALLRSSLELQKHLIREIYPLT